MQTDADRDDLRQLVARSPLLPDAVLRDQWLRVIDWLPPAARQEIREVLLAAEETCRD